MARTTRVLRAGTMRVLLTGLRVYTRLMPWNRGRGLFVRPIETLKRRGWSAPLVPIAGNLAMEFEPSLLGWTVFEHGEWEPEQTRVILELLKPRDVVVNVGANTGYYALLAGAAVGPDGHVYAFEIQPSMARTLRANVELNGLRDRITVEETGCFSEPGTAVIESHGDPGSARIAFSESGIQVPLTTLDSYFLTRVERVNVIIIDTEGADFEVLKGAEGVLKRFRPTVVAETHHLGAFGGSEAELTTFMAGLGYESRPLQGQFSRDVVFVPVS